MILLKTLAFVALGIWLFTMSVHGFTRGYMLDQGWVRIYRSESPVHFWIQWCIITAFAICSVIAVISLHS